MTTLRTTRRTARKRHQCWYCYGHVEPGEVYYDSAFIDEDAGFCTVAEHEDCREAVERYYSVGGDPEDLACPQPRGKTPDEAERARELAGGGKE